MKHALLVVPVLLTAACSGHSSKVTIQPTPSASPTPVQTTALPQPTVTASATPSPTAASVSLPGPAGTKVDKGFTPRSATFISATTGWVLGQAPCETGKGSCDEVARTRDGGKTWLAIPSPATSPDNLAEIRFADVDNGFITGNELWATHDGGATWKVVPGGPTQVAASAGRVWDEQDGQLFSAPAGGGAFVSEADGDKIDSFVLHGTTAYAVQHAATTLLVGSHNSSFSQVATPCTNADEDQEPVLGIETSNDWLLICAGGVGAGMEQKTAYTTSDGGKHWLKRADPPQVSGDDVSVTDDGYFVADHQDISVTRDGGKTWSTSLQSGGGINESGFESAELGYAIGYFGTGQVESMKVSHDAGRVWSDVAF